MFKNTQAKSYTVLKKLIHMKTKTYKKSENIKLEIPISRGGKVEGVLQRVHKGLNNWKYSISLILVTLYSQTRGQI